MIRTGSVGGFQSGFKGGGGIGMPSFMPKIKAGAANLVDMASGVAATNAISGVRYGIVNGVVTEFAVNQPAIEDNGFRACPAFTQFLKYTERLDLWEIRGAVTIIDGYVTKSDSEIGWLATISGTSSTHFPLESSVFASIELIGTGSVGINLVVLGGTSGASDLIDTISGQRYVTITLNPVIPQKIVFRGIIDQNDKDSFIIRLLSLSDPFSFKILGEGAQITISQTKMPYVPNNTETTVSVVSEAATKTNGTSFDLDDVKLAMLNSALRGPDAQGHLELELVSNSDSTWWPNNSVSNLLSVSNNAEGLLYIHKDSGGIVSFMASDGTNTSSVTQGLSISTEYKISLDWGTHPTGQKMRITINGIQSSLGDFNGFWGTEDLSFFFNSLIHIGWIKKNSLKIYNKPRW